MVENLITPTLRGIALDSTTIRWYWANEGNSHSLYDENGNILFQLATNISRYDETNLKPNTSYTRKLKAFDENGESEFSTQVTVTTKEEVSENNLIEPFKDDFKNTFNVLDSTVIKDNLKAFISGVGDRYDLKIFKQDINDYNNSFNLIGKVYGKYFKNITSFQKTTFNYRVKAIGKYQKKTCQGFVKLKLKATTTDKVKIRVYRYALKTIDVSSKLECKVSYYEESGGVWYPKTRTLTSREFGATMPVSASYTEFGNAVLDSKNNILMESSPIRNIMWDIAMSDPVIKRSHDNGKTVQLFEYKLFDNYPFNTTNNRYSPSKARPFTLSQDGTIQAHTSSSVNTNIDSGIYMSGYSEGQMFDVEKVIEKEITGDNTPVTIITKSEINKLIPTCISDRSYAFDGNAQTIITKIEVVKKGPTVKILNNNLNDEDTFIVSANTIHETPILTYNFNDNTKNHYVSTENIFSNMIKDYSIIYNYDLRIVECTSNIKINGQEQIDSGNQITWTDDYMSGFALEAVESLVELPWETTYPEYPNEGFNGLVNGENSLDGTCVKKDLVVQLPEIYIPQEMYDVGFKVIVENIYPLNSHLGYKLAHQGPNGYSNVNADFVVFNSEATKPEVKEIKDLLSIENLDTIVLKDTTTKEMVIKVTKPILTTTQNNLYTSFELNLSTDSSDIQISDYPINLVFDENNSMVVPYKCKVMRNATSKWSPYIHNGYYYINQHEYYLFSQSNIKGEYTDNYSYKSKNVNYSILVDLKKQEGTNDKYTYLYKEKHDYNITPNSTVEFNKGYIFPLPTLSGKYYKQYKNTEFILNEIILPKKATSYEKLQYGTSDSSNQISVYARSIDENGLWSNWTLVNFDTVPKIPLSYKVQLKVGFKPVVENEKRNITETLSNCLDFDEDLDNVATSNVLTNNGIVEAINKDKNGLYISKVIDYGIETDIKVETYYTCENTNNSHYVTIHVASGDNYDEVKHNPTWHLMDGITQVSGRYMKYRIEFTSNIKIIAIYKYLNTTKTLTTPQGINNISFSANVLIDNLQDKSISIDRISEIKYNKERHLVINNVREAILPVISSYGYTGEDIGTVAVRSGDEDFEVTLEDNVIDFEKQLLSEVFSVWNRFSIANIKDHNELNYWVMDNGLKEINYNHLSKTYVGLVSPQKYLNFEIRTTINSKSLNDNPICIVLAYNTDSYGNEYTLSLLVSPSSDSYKVVYNYNMPNEKIIGDYKHLVVNNPDIIYWANMDYGIRINVVRTNNTFVIKRSQENQSLLDDNTMITINLNDYPQLAIFLSGASFGFGSFNVRSIFKNLALIISDKGNSSVFIQSKTTQINHKDGEFLKVTNNELTISPAPQQYSPVVISSTELGELRRIFYRDSEGKYSLDIVEEYFPNSGEVYNLTENNIDMTTLVVKVNDSVITNHTLKEHILTVPKENIKNETDIISVKYRVKNSFVANYNYFNNSVNIKLHTEKPLETVIARYETNLNDNRQELKNISLNPIHNTDYKGFIYLSYENNIIDKIIIHANPKSVSANGIDSTSLYFEVLDKIGNPVQNVELNSYCTTGSLIQNEALTDENGVITARYISSNKPGVDTITVFNEKYSITESIAITNMEVK